MKKTSHAILAAILALPGLALAAGPLEVSEEVIIDAYAEDVWSVISDYCAIEDWHPAVTDCTHDGNAPQAGAMRVLTLGNSEQLHERLQGYGDMSYSYSIPQENLKALPIRNYESTIRIERTGENQAIATWEGSFDRGDPTEPPSDDLSDAVALETISAVYMGGLAQIKQLAESIK